MSTDLEPPSSSGSARTLRDMWCRCVLSMSMIRGLSFFPSTERIDDVVLVDDVMSMNNAGETT